MFYLMSAWVFLHGYLRDFALCIYFAPFNSFLFRRILSKVLFHLYLVMRTPPLDMLNCVGAIVVAKKLRR